METSPIFEFFVYQDDKFDAAIIDTSQVSLILSGLSDHEEKMHWAQIHMKNGSILTLQVDQQTIASLAYLMSKWNPQTST